ncbi:hypothetical protein ERJ75_000326700 [Trypanosoma vivax]|nr:hypothetical protein ERJ75_000326700 [Trypanosoma vivax]
MVATGAVYASTIIGVPPYAAAALFSDIMRVKDFGVDGLMSCCVMENVLNPTQIGAVRRLTLAFPTVEGKILRERLAAVEDEEFRMTTRMEYIPCDPHDIQRSALGREGSMVLKQATSEIVVNSVTTNPNKCFVEITVRFEVNVERPPESSHRTRDEIKFLDIKRFWQLYSERTVKAAEEYLLSFAIPEVKPPIITKTEKDYFDVEQKLCEWSVDNSPFLPRADVLQTLERALNSWGYIRREIKHQELINIRLEKDFAGAKAVAATAAAVAAAAAASDTCPTSPFTQFHEGSFGAASLNNMVKTTHSTVPSVICRQGTNAPLHVPDFEKNASCASGSVRSPKEFLPALVPEKKAEAEELPHRPFFTRGGGRALSVPSSETGERVEKNTQSPQQPMVLRRISYSVLRDMISERGVIDDAHAQELFNMLDVYNRGFITEQEVISIIAHIDPLGLYEDKDGTLQVLAASREALGKEIHGIGMHNFSASDESPYSVATTEGRNSSINALSLPSSTDTRDPVAGKYSALQALVIRHEKQKRKLFEEAVKQRAAELIGKYAYRTRGRLHFDEFCLMMIHILKEC